MGESAEDAEFAVRLKSENAESGRNDVPLSLVVRSRDSFVGAVALHRVLSASELVGQHAADGFVQDSGGSPVVEGSPLGVDQATLAKVIHVLELVAVEASGNVNSLAPDDDDSLPLEKRLGNDGGEASKEMTAAIDDHWLGGETHLELYFINR